MKVKIKVILTVILIGVVAVGTSYIRAQGTASISGKVVDKETGQPVANAKVFVQSQDLSQGSVAASDEQGNYAISNLPSGTYQLFVEADVYSRDILKEATLSEGQILENQDLQLVKEGIIEGKVTKQGGTGLSDIEVWAYQETGTSFGSAKTDAQGNYKITGLAEGAFTVSVRAEGYVAEIKNDVHVNVGQTTSGVEFALVLQGVISGRVTTEDGIAIPNAEIFIMKAADRTGVTMTTTTTDGIYKIGNLLAGSYDVVASLDGFVEIEKADIFVAAGQELQGIDFVLTKAGSISGKVTDSNGTPITGAHVFASESETKGESSVTDQDGVFKIINLQAGNYNVFALIEGQQYPLSRENTVEVQEGSEVRDVDFILSSLGSLSGKVYQSDDATPLEGVLVSATNIDDGMIFFATSGQDGVYELKDIRAGIYMINFMKEGFPNVDLNKVEIRAGTSLGNMDVVMAEGSVSGRVTSQDGTTPIGGTIIIAKALYPFVDYQLATADSDGKYQLDNLTPAQYEIVAAKEGFNSSVMENIPVQGNSVQENVNFSLTQR